jgi:AcrR family transcriptional regulator
MARPKAADHDAQRDHILAHAVAAFADHGYASASMAELALRSGVSKAGLYHYYTQKEALLFDALMRYTDRLLEICASASAQGDPHARLSDLVARFIEEYQTSRAHHMVLLNDVKFLAPAQRALIEGQQRQVVNTFATTIAQAYPQHAQEPSLKATTMALLGMINFMFAWFKGQGPLSHAQFAQLVIGLWTSALAAPQPSWKSPA